MRITPECICEIITQHQVRQHTGTNVDAERRKRVDKEEKDPVVATADTVAYPRAREML